METGFIIFTTAVIVVIGVLIYATMNSQSSVDSNSSTNATTGAVAMTTTDSGATSNNDSKEGFLLTSQDAYVSPVTGAIKGPGIMTDQMTRMPVDDITKLVNANGFVSDNAISLGVSPGDGFDKAYTNQQQIQNIDDRAVDGYQSVQDLDAISKRIASNTNNSSSNVYTRAGSRPTKLLLAPNEIRGVIDEKYLPDRDKNHQIAVVGTVVPMQGYDVDVEKLGEQLIDTHFSKFSSNRKTKRIATAAGARGNIGNSSRTLDSNVFGSDDRGVNADAIQNNVDIVGDNILINDSITGETIAAPLDENVPESFKNRYAH